MPKKLNVISVLAAVCGIGESTCEACGSEFTCGASLRGCWCSEITLTDEARADLRARYSRCLCRKCLEEIAASHESEKKI